MELKVALLPLCSKFTIGFMYDRFMSTVLLLCEAETTVPSISHNAFAVGVIVIVSLPSETPLVLNCKIISGPYPPDIEVGVALVSVAVPPESANEKSDT